MKFYSSKIAVSKPISLEEAAAKAKQQPQVRTLDEIIKSAKEIKQAAANATVKTAAVQVKVATDFAEVPSEPIADPVSDVPPATPAPAGDPLAADPLASAAPAPAAGPAPIPVAPNDPAAPAPAPAPADPLAVSAPAAGPAPIPPAPKAAPAPAPIPMGDPLEADPLAAAASGKKGTFKMAKSINFTAWPEEQKVIDHWKSYGSHEKCLAGVAGKTTNPQAYCTLLSKAAEMASAQLVKKAAAAKAAKEASKQEASKDSPAFKRFAKLTEKEQSFLREFFSKIYGKEYVSALLGDY